MIRKVLPLLVLSAVVVSLAVAGGVKKRPVAEAEPDESRLSDLVNVPFTKVPDPDWSTFQTPVGTPTTLSGFYDYQSNGGSLQHIRVNPANGNIHVIYMLAEDSTAGGLSASRRTAYAFSSNGGVSWNNFNNVRVPARLSGFPTIDLLRGVNAGLPVIANHSTITGTQSTIFVDSPEGSGAFSELNAPPTLPVTQQPIWPYVAGASDGSVTMMATQNITGATSGVAHQNRMPADFSGWGAWDTWTGDVQGGGRYPTHANGTGRVGILLNTSNGTAVLGNRWRESTDNGVTWTAPVNLYGQRVVGTDTFYSYVHADFVYNGDTPLYVFSEFKINQGFVDYPQIVFWSQATGFRVAVPYDSTKYFWDPINQRFHRDPLGWPSIGLSGNTIVVAYQGFQADTDSRGYHYSDLWYVTSTNGGNSWSAPVRITNTPQLDERYPSVSKWNAPGQFNMTWSQKSKSGLYAFPGDADTVRASQMFLRVTLSDVGDREGAVPQTFRLSQNYPNPFNPATKIDYTVAKAGRVSIKVYNTLGQEVATVVNEELAPGHYQATFDGANLPSGVYVYTMRAGGYVESRKMMLLR
jgi:hypothetical protein